MTAHAFAVISGAIAPESLILGGTSVFLKVFWDIFAPLWKKRKMTEELEIQVWPVQWGEYWFKLKNGDRGCLRNVSLFVSYHCTKDDVLPSDAHITPEHFIPIRDHVISVKSQVVHSVTKIDLASGATESYTIAQVVGRELRVPSEEGDRARVHLARKRYTVRVTVTSDNTYAKDFFLELDPDSESLKLFDPATCFTDRFVGGLEF